MTTIAFKKVDGKVIIGADSQLTWGNVRLKCTKLAVLSDGSVLGLAGGGVLTNKIQEWWEDGRESECPVKEGKEDEEEESCQGLLVDYEGSVFMLLRGINPIEIDDEFGAIGSGADYARSKLALGADVEDAIKHASQFDIYTDGNVKLMEIVL